MLISEFAPPVNADRLAALAEFISRRAEDENIRREISASAFINLARGMGIPLTVSQLKIISQEPPLSNLIANVEGPDNDPDAVKIKFRPESDSEPNQMSPDQAKKTVDSMAKRAIDINKKP